MHKHTPHAPPGDSEHFNSTAVQGTRQVYYGHTCASRRGTQSTDAAGHYTWESGPTSLTLPARILAQWGLWKGRVSVRLSACPADQWQQQRSAGLLLSAGVIIIIIMDIFLSKQQNCKGHWCLQVISIDSCGRRAASAGAQQQMRAASC